MELKSRYWENDNLELEITGFEVMEVEDAMAIPETGASTIPVAFTSCCCCI